MAWLLPGRLWAVLPATIAFLGLSAPACGTNASLRSRRLPPSVFQAAKIEAKSYRAVQPPSGRAEGAWLVEQALRRAGLRFGTDGSTGALWGYLSYTHQRIRALDARPGDVLFFDTQQIWGSADCERADHAAVVESVAADGRIAFWDARGGLVRRSFVDPSRPTLRRNARGEIANSFLRVKAVGDDPSTPYFAGEMLCGVIRVLHP